MLSSLEFTLPNNQSSIIKVIGVGGGGGNAVNTMYMQGIQGVEFCICNTDIKALDVSPIPNKVRLGQAITEGLGAGADPAKGRAAAEESLEEIRELLKNNTKMVFVTAGMGGGTGTGAAPVIAKLAKEMDILTVGIVTTPFDFEGVQRIRKSKDGLQWMRDSVDTLLIINNDNLFDLDSDDMTQAEAFEASDRVLFNAAKGISEIVNDHGEMGGINVDFADVTRVMKNGGTALMGSATFSGNDRARKAAEEALASPLLENVDIRGSKALLVNITANKANLKMSETKTIMNYIKDMAGEQAEVIMGTVYNAEMGDSINVTVIATGFSDGASEVKLVNQNEPMESGYSPRNNTPSKAEFEVTPVEAVPVPPQPQNQPSLFTAIPGDTEAENKHSLRERQDKLKGDRYSGSDLDSRRKMEDEPAIDRMKNNGFHNNMSQDRVISRFSIDLESRGGIRYNDNPFLHGNPD